MAIFDEVKRGIEHLMNDCESSVYIIQTIEEDIEKVVGVCKDFTASVKLAKQHAKNNNYCYSYSINKWKFDSIDQGICFYVLTRAQLLDDKLIN